MAVRRRLACQQATSCRRCRLAPTPRHSAPRGRRLPRPLKVSDPRCLLSVPRFVLSLPVAHWSLFPQYLGLGLCPRSPRYPRLLTSLLLIPLECSFAVGSPLSVLMPGSKQPSPPHLDVVGGTGASSPASPTNLNGVCACVSACRLPSPCSWAQFPRSLQYVPCVGGSGASSAGPGSAGAGAAAPGGLRPLQTSQSQSQFALYSPEAGPSALLAAVPSPLNRLALQQQQQQSQRQQQPISAAPPGGPLFAPGQYVTQPGPLHADVPSSGAGAGAGAAGASRQLQPSQLQLQQQQQQPQLDAASAPVTEEGSSVDHPDIDAFGRGLQDDAPQDPSVAACFPSVCLLMRQLIVQ